MMDMEIDKSNILYKINKDSFKPDKKYKITLPHPESDIQIMISYDNVKSGKIIFAGKGIYSRKTEEYGDFIVLFV
jgi:hypothetical protein